MARLEQLLTFLEQSPNDSFILFALAKEHEKLAELQQSKTYYERLRTEHKDYVGTYYHLGKLYEKLDQIEEAIVVYKEGMAVAKAQNDNHAYSELAGAKMNIDEDED